MTAPLRPSEPYGMRRTLSIGLVNNMPDGALRATERQFTTLLAAAARGTPLEIKLFSLPGCPRGDKAAAYIADRYTDFGAIWNMPLDGLIVTGAEPRAPTLREEPYWSYLERLIDWADANTTSSVWLCLAAHAAVLHLDGIGRQSFTRKLSGIFECFKIAEHPLLAGSPAVSCVAHSRSNNLSLHDLVDHGYTILSWSENPGADIFVKQRTSMFVFMQGHLEYDADTIMREYRRDIARFQAGELHNCPEVPSGYFDPTDEITICGLRQELLADRYGRHPVQTATAIRAMGGKSVEDPCRADLRKLVAVSSPG